MIYLKTAQMLVRDQEQSIRSNSNADGLLAPLFPTVMNLRVAAESQFVSREKVAAMAKDLEGNLLQLFNWFEAWEAQCREEQDMAMETANAEIERLQAAVDNPDRREVHKLNDPDVRRRVFSMTGGKCAYCDRELIDGAGDAPESMCIEHVVPRSNGGPDHLTNFVPSCRPCNTGKSDRHVLYFVRRMLRKPELVVDNTAELTLESNDGAAA